MIFSYFHPISIGKLGSSFSLKMVSNLPLFFHIVDAKKKKERGSKSRRVDIEQQKRCAVFDS